MNKIILCMLILCSFVIADNNCSQAYHCEKQINEKDHSKYDLTCTLPNTPTFTITVPDVFNLDEEGQPSTLKKYFGTGETVCDVLGWFNYEIPYMQSHYPKFSETIKKPLALTFFS